jgi:hypothetical protein
MAQPGATTPRRLGLGAPTRRRAPILVARAPWPETAEPPVHGRWPRALGMLLAIAVSAVLWALLIWGVCVLVG